ncbi:DUF5048 domain-containing protein [Anaerovorax sp. IOR16]|uniref:DUF5048 domain-containing protein n=1 Tax=Anaerovorax sp. IOR16 TaxID=2773458 RepID=UPI0019D2B52D|nr:DUF5048 domain-containing protein [Anaerovorax sp. IOR16]
MSYQIKQEDVLMLHQAIMKIKIKAEILDMNFKTIDKLDGELIDDSFSITAESDIRRTANLTILAKDDLYILGSKTKIWINKYIKLSVGFYNIRQKEYVYYPAGIYIIATSSYKYNNSACVLTLSIVDMMGLATGLIGSQLKGLENEILVGTNIRDAEISIITKELGLNKFRIDDIGKTVPYDLKFPTGTNPYTVLKELIDLYSGWEMFFDEDTFVIQKIPTLESDEVIIDAETMKQLVIDENNSEELNIDLTKIKNISDIWGQSLDTDYYTEICTSSETTYNLSIDGVTELKKYDRYGFKPDTTNGLNQQIKINSLASYPIIDDKGNSIKDGIIQSGKPVVVEYRDKSFLFLGRTQIHGITKLYCNPLTPEQIMQDKINENCENIHYIFNSLSPFGVDLIGEKRQVLSDDEYANIYSEELAIMRSDYENWKSTRLNSDITITIKTIPWLDVNKKIEWYSPSLKTTEQYIIKNISGSFSSGIQTIQMVRFYPDYPFVVKN